MKRSKGVAGISVFLLLIGMAWQVYAGDDSTIDTATMDETSKRNAWVEAQFKKLSPVQRIGHLFMVAAYTEAGNTHKKKLAAWIKKYQLGGIILFHGKSAALAEWSNFCQTQSKIPLLVGLDAEWGPSMRVRDAMAWPKQLLLGAIQENHLIYNYGRAVAEQCKRLGVSLNFAPVVDINNNPNNPVIGLRSFGEQRLNVTAKSFMYMKGLQDQNVMACAKHFPGHGDTDVDSHEDLPVITHSRARLDSIEFYPFRILAQQGLQSAMIGHLNVPALDARANTPSTLSKPIITDILKNELGFDGLIFTDAMGMKGVTKHVENGVADRKAILAGVDMVLMPEDVDAGIAQVQAAIREGKITQAEIDARVRKILHAKYKLGLADYKPVSTTHVREDINAPKYQRLKEKLIQKGITLVTNTDDLLPLGDKKQRLASLSIGRNQKTPFQKELDRYEPKVVDFYTSRSISAGRAKQLLTSLSKYDVVLISLHRLGRSGKTKYNISDTALKLIQQLQKRTKVVVVAFGTPYALRYVENSTSVIAAYSEDKTVQKLTAQAIFGGIGFAGKLPVTVSPKLSYQMGLSTQPHRMPYREAHTAGFDVERLKKIDTIAEEAIRIGATPGCQVLVAKDGAIVFHKAYGHHTYNAKQKVDVDDIYDVASVTKVAATTIALMKLHEQGRISIFKSLGAYLPEARGTNKAGLNIQAILAHQAGLKPWIPFYLKTMENKKPRADMYNVFAKEHFTQQVDDVMFFSEQACDSLVWQRIYDSELRRGKRYKYSDLGFYLFTKLIEYQSGLPLNEYVDQVFYRPMGLSSTSFKPLQRGFSRARIVPTELDRYFRYKKVHGHVHDMGAAMLDGVAGHAGLFSTAKDLAAIFQMLLNKGVYNNRRYLKTETVELFTKQYNKRARRGTGFDRKEKSDSTPPVSYNVAHQASEHTFGHQGFTGIGAWADPEHNLIYIFLSNRTYPEGGENRKLQKHDIRSRIQEAVYEALLDE